MTKRPIMWSDEELRQAWIGGWNEKTASGAARVFLTALGAVHPAECREREREAWRCGVNAIGLTPEISSWGDKERSALIQRDKVLPSLLPKSLPPLVLSTGTWRRIDVGCYCGKWDGGDAMVQTTPTIGTRSDAIAFASWLTQYGSEEERK